ncbi:MULTISPECIES: alpha/beta fold hydrolase [Robiginitalea]|uniref:Hydrolase, putative n=1 Tax=Robiginitalea biformata (strain ATCC BAA-864 / DSM 15991 / KCTC 12146 / HTCC2501) TaxID=313596 RepID=A4CJZ4_ROBBH|nr:MULTISPECIES: alpha/beta hydrolase [Robiginitalea]EAR17252.1 hydrolase, putative [Robiginitalea biformata HTCC2501]MDC6355457.1 alpha/beta hydrolase [Robiginitalea sp. PM2]MDC6375933.1 alpha/beta hydrolase [Robiginitalea sp. SP8]
MNKLRTALKRLQPRLIGWYLNLLVLISPSRAARKAFFVFSKVRRGRVQPAQQDYLQAARHKVESVADHQIQTYQWSGDGPVVLLIHGWESNTFRWRNLIGHLREAGFHIVAFDAPAHGYSSGTYMHVPMYAECVEHMVQKFQPRYIVGHSVGGMTALYHAHRHPNEGVEKIVTIGSPSEFYEIMEDYQRIVGFNDRVMQALDQFIFEEFGYHTHEFSTSRFVEGNPKKGLILHDKSDPITPFHASVRVHNAWRESVLVPTEGLGHSMHQEAVNKRIVAFLSES